MEKKKHFIDRLKEKWGNLSDEAKCAIVGLIAGIGITSGVAAGVGAFKIRKFEQKSDAELKLAIDLAYKDGINRGETQAYYNLLTNPKNAFKRMGLENIKEF